MLERMLVPPSVQAGEGVHFAAIKLGQLAASSFTEAAPGVGCHQQEIVSQTQGRAESLKKGSQGQGRKGTRNVVLGQKLCFKLLFWAQNCVTQIPGFRCCCG